MPKLTDTHTLLLAHAAQRESGSLFPLPDALAGTTRCIKAVAALLRQGLVAEQDASTANETARHDDDRAIGVFITPAGLAAINISDTEPAGATAPVTEVTHTSAPRITKVLTLVALLERDEGATLPDLVAATGWLPHTTRAALTGLRKKGHAIERSRRDGVSCYRIVRAA